MMEKLQVDFEEVVKVSGMLVMEEEICDCFNVIVMEEGIIMNIFCMFLFW